MMNAPVPSITEVSKLFARRFCIIPCGDDPGHALHALPSYHFIGRQQFRIPISIWEFRPINAMHVKQLKCHECTSTGYLHSRQQGPGLPHTPTMIGFRRIPGVGYQINDSYLKKIVYKLMTSSCCNGQ
jgi:hypothetical protein